MKQLQYKNSIIPGYFISEEGKIYDSNGVEQEQKFCQSRGYFYFKRHGVHQMMAHSFFGYKEGFDVHHKNEIKTDNRLDNLMYLTRADHISLHKTGKKYCLGKKLSPVTKQKMSAARKDKKPVYCLQLDKVFESIIQAARELSIAQSSICLCCNGKLKTTRGFHFSYYSGDSK